MLSPPFAASFVKAPKFKVAIPPDGLPDDADEVPVTLDELASGRLGSGCWNVDE
jgi:hypothetical protein